MTRRALAVVLGALAAALGACASDGPASREVVAEGGAIVIGGRRVPLDAPVVLWSDPGGYDAYRRTRFFAPEETLPSRPERGTARPERFDVRAVDGLSEEIRARVRATGFGPEELRARIDQFVVHYDVCGTSRRCFEVLHDVRGLSVHFLLDVDGVLYQTLDVRERARHAGVANDRSIGVEIAHCGAYRDFAVLGRWYPRAADGGRVLRLPADLADDVRTPGFVGRPARPDPVRGVIHGAEYVQFDYTPEQYRTLARLLAALHRELPGIALEAPRGADGRVLDRVLTPEERTAFRGVLGHWHVSASKQDPGPAFAWDEVLGEARRLAEAAGAGTDR